MKAVQKLNTDKLHIVGDIHGELEPFLELLNTLGYDEDGYHPENYKLAFVGDLVNRGQNSFKVVQVVKRIIENGNGQAVIGNHEMNILDGKPRDGTGWFIDEQVPLDKKYEPYFKIKDEDKSDVLDFFKTLPLALESDKVRIVHACWDHTAIDLVRNLDTTDLLPLYLKRRDSNTNDVLNSIDSDLYFKEFSKYKNHIKDPEYNFDNVHPIIIEYEERLQNNNPFYVLLTGRCYKSPHPKFLGGKWRFIDREPWWDSYNDEQAVIIGHYWRSSNHNISKALHNELFINHPINSWLGKRKNVFCVDYSIGASYLERKENKPKSHYGKLAALEWPTKSLIFSDGIRMSTFI